MLFAFSMFKLYSRNSKPRDIGDAELESDEFIEGLDYCKYQKPYRVYNTHMIPHLVILCKIQDINNK